LGNAGVWVYDNYIHDNQHPTHCDGSLGANTGFGYGVVVSYGGFAYIQGNVFDLNRHAIAGHGTNGDGYVAIGNLFFDPGMDHDNDGFDFPNHQIDMHGLNTCPNIDDSAFNCGQAGYYIEVENNIVVGNDAAAVHLRGTPTSYNAATNTGGMYVHDNAINGA